MKNNKRIMAMILTLILAVSMVTGCSKGTSKEEPTPAPDTANQTEPAKSEDATKPSEKTKVVIWSKDRHDADFITQKVTEYNASNTDNIEVNFQIYTENYQQAIEIAFQAGEAPDVFSQEAKVYESLLGSGNLADLTPIMDEEFLNVFGSAIIPGLNQIDGKVYYIPLTGTTGRLFYNKDIFTKAGIANPPATFEEMIADAKLITSKLSGEGIYGFAANLKNPASAFNRTILYQVERQLGLHHGYNFATGKYEFAAYADLINLWRELLSPDAAFPGCESLDIDPLRTQFAAGKIGMYISFTHAEPGVYKNQFPMEQEWGCVQIPTMGGKVVGAQRYEANSGMLFNTNSEHLDAAWKAYTAIYANVENQVGYYENGLGISTIPAVIEKAKPAQVYLDNPALLIGETDKIWPLNPQEMNTSTFILEGLDDNATFFSLVYSKDDIAEGLKDLEDRYNAALNAGVEEGTFEATVIPGFDPMNPSK